jgi:1-acyl-sn-glycerol-3-phosphate acyltransferase
MAIKGQAPVVPVAIVGTLDAMKKGSLVIRPVRVRIRLARPIETAGFSVDDRDRLVTAVRAEVSRLLQGVNEADVVNGRS